MPTSDSPWASARFAICTALGRPFARGIDASTSVYPSANVQVVSVVVFGAAVVVGGATVVTTGGAVVAVGTVPKIGRLGTVVLGGRFVATSVCSPSSPWETAIATRAPSAASTRMTRIGQTGPPGRRS